MTQADIAKYWDAKAEALTTDPSATMKDVILRSIEIEAIADRLSKDDDLLDVGGGNAYAGLIWSDTCRSVLVTDFSENMVQFGQIAISKSDRRNVKTERADVLNLSRYREQFSATTCVRCLINLSDSQDQLTAVRELANTLKPGGRLFLIEGFQETFDTMNAMRKSMGLPAVELDWHNRLLQRSELETVLLESLQIDERVDFGEYYFLSRIVHPLLVAPEEPQFKSRCNDVAKLLWHSGIARGRFSDMSTLVLYVCSKPVARI